MMTDPVIYLERISEFARFLRSEGFAVGLQETADACQILSTMELTDRTQVKNALRAVFAKSQTELLSFDRCFDGFFVSAEARQANNEKRVQQEQELARRRQEADEELRYNGEPLDLSSDLKDVYVRMPENQRQKLRSFMERYKNNIERSPNLYSSFIRSVFMRALLEQQMAMEDAAAHAEALDDPDLDLLFRDISLFHENEVPRAIALITRITQQFNAELNAKRHKSGKSSTLDFKHTIRKGLETGGSFYRLHYKKRHSKRRKLVLLCDVSGSMLQFSEFALHFIRSMATVSDHSRTFLFSEELHEADSFSMQSMESFRGYVKSTGLYGRGTNLGEALQELLAIKPSVLGPATTLLILSDTKTVSMERAVAALMEARHRAGNIVWLNPIPERKWPYIRSVATVSSLCQMIPCSTLSELARACKKIAKT